MCGIAGIIASDINNHPEIIKNVISAIKHRGPDGQGIHFFEDGVFAHSRLSIIDLSDAAKQPMISSLSGNIITFNGEIYGYKDIKKDLNDYPFKTMSDTEVILALYDKYNTNMMSKLPGMFSFAIWDQSEKKLFAARDRFGEKPFYYAFGRNGEFIFASEIKAILKSELLDPVLDYDSVGHYLKFGHIHVGKSIYKNIHSLQPAHQLVFKEGNLNITPYWELPETNTKMKRYESVEGFAHYFKKAIEKQCISDVPVGAFLSGGLDSTSVVIEALKHIPNLNTFSLGIENSKEVKTELPYARAVADMYKTNHTEMTFNPDNLAELLIKMQDIYDEPFAASSNIPTYLISKLAQPHNKVILTGDGADELLGGYPWNYRRLRDLLHKRGFYYIQSCTPICLQRKFFKRVFKREEFLSSGQSVSQYHYNKKALFTNDDLLTLGVPITDRINEGFINFDTKTFDDAMRCDLKNYMPGEVLTKIDRASMSNGVELRSPFLDVDLAEFCISMPCDFKIDDYKDKLPLRKNYEKMWPKLIQNRSKQGFGGPVLEWLSRPEVIDLKNEYLKNKNNKIFTFLDYEKVQKITQDKNFKEWNLLILSMWLEKKFIGSL